MLRERNPWEQEEGGAHGRNCRCEDCDGGRVDATHEARQEARAERMESNE
jgi:hypothetical protein